MDTITRRRFLTAGGVVAAGALAAGGTAYGLHEILDTAGQREPGRILVLVTLYGGNDGLNTVIPYADPAYAAARPGLTYDEGAVLELGEGFGLNPGLKGLHKLYGEERLAIVRGVGYPKPDRSHFRSMDIWQTASPERPAGTGWLGRWLDSVGGDPRLAVSFEPVLPPLLAGATSAGATVPGGAVQLPAGVTTPILTGLGAAAAGESPARARAATCFADLVRVQDLMTGVATTDEDADEPDAPAGRRRRWTSSSPWWRAAWRRVPPPGSTRCRWAVSTCTPTRRPPRRPCSPSWTSRWPRSRSGWPAATPGVTSSSRSTRSSAAGSRRTRRTAPTTARRPRCCCSVPA
jgi:hypothetical protein